MISSLLVATAIHWTFHAVSLQEVRATIESGDLRRAAHMLDTAVQEDPKNVDVLWAAALVAEKLEDPTKETLYLEQLVAMDPHNDVARTRLARAYWQAGKSEQAQPALSHVLHRQPNYQPALDLQKQIASPPPSAATKWRPQLRVGLWTGLDSNVTFDPGTVTSASDRRALLGAVDLNAGAAYATELRPFTAFARLSTATALTGDATLDDFIPTVVGLAAIGRHMVGPVLGTLDVRYDELFTDFFGTHRQRTISPTLFGTYALSSNNKLRLLVGNEFRMPDKLINNNWTLKIAARDQWTIAKFLFAVDVGVRRNAALADKTVVPTATDFSELFATLFGQLPIAGELTGIVALEGQARRFIAGGKQGQELKESTYRAQVGLRYGFADWEIHADYSFLTNRSNDLRSYNKHQAIAGVRYWFD